MRAGAKRVRRQLRQVEGAGELSTGAGAAMVLALLWVLTSMGHQAMDKHERR